MSDFKDLRYEVLRILQIITFAATSLAAISNTINHRPIFMTLQPVLATFFILVLWYFEKKSPRSKHISKLVFMMFFNIFYIPFAWIYSPGLSSTIGYYAIFTIMISVFFVENRLEFLIPMFTLIFSVFMIRFELSNPDFFIPFVDRTTRFNDVTINFLVVAILTFVVITYINRHYVAEKERFYKQSVTDELTGIYNRRYLLTSIEKLSNEEHEFSVLFIDVNNFKEINDTYGHHKGDEVLIEIGRLLQSSFQICGRFGGDEFMGVLLSTEKSIIDDAIESIKGQFRSYSIENGFDNLSLSVGYTISQDKSAEKMIKEADAYMYKNKHKEKFQTN